MPKLIKPEVIAAVLYTTSAGAVSFWGMKETAKRVEKLRKEYPNHTVEFQPKAFGSRLFSFVPVIKPKPTTDEDESNKPKLY
jgi:hypothetical protein